jgi:hypothetical protein
MVNVMKGAAPIKIEFLVKASSHTIIIPAIKNDNYARFNEDDSIRTFFNCRNEFKIYIVVKINLIMLTPMALDYYCIEY